MNVALRDDEKDAARGLAMQRIGAGRNSTATGAFAGVQHLTRDFDGPVIALP